MSGVREHPDLLALVAGTLPSEAAEAAAAHLGGCDACRSEESSLRSMRRSLLAEAAGGHVVPSDLVAYDEERDSLEEASRSRIALHLAACADCRADLEAMAQARARRAIEAGTQNVLAGGRR